MSGKLCIPCSDSTFCGVWVFIAEAYLTQYLRLLPYFLHNLNYSRLSLSWSPRDFLKYFRDIGTLTYEICRIAAKINQTRKGFFRKKNNKCPPQSRQSCHSCMQYVISSCSTFVPSIIKIFCRVLVLQSRDKKSNSNTRRGDNSKSKTSQSCHSFMWHVVWSCSSLLPNIIKIFQRVFDLHSRH